MTEPVFLTDPYARTALAQVSAHDDARHGVVLDRTLFYATGGGQPGDSGALTWEGGAMRVVEAVKGGGAAILLLAEPDSALPPVGMAVEQHLDWPRRFSHMRVHTALHLLSVAIPLPVTGGAIAEGKGRLDFDMPEMPQEKADLERALQALIDRDLAVTESWISDAELDANPGLVKTMSVAPPRGAGRVRLVRIGTETDQVDLQPCGGTHVARTSEIGRIRIGKVEKKGRQNRRIYLHLDD